jgi:hypothetical protein
MVDRLRACLYHVESFQDKEVSEVLKRVLAMTNCTVASGQILSPQNVISKIAPWFLEGKDFLDWRPLTNELNFKYDTVKEWQSLLSKQSSTEDPDLQNPDVSQVKKSARTRPQCGEMWLVKQFSPKKMEIRWKRADVIAVNGSTRYTVLFENGDVRMVALKHMRRPQKDDSRYLTESRKERLENILKRIEEGEIRPNQIRGRRRKRAFDETPRDLQPKVGRYIPPAENENSN